MSRLRVLLIRYGFVMWNRGQLTRIRRAYTPDVTANAPTVWLEGQGHATGPQAIVESFASLREAFDTHEVVVERLIGVGRTVFGAIVMRGIPRGATGIVEQRLIATYTFRGLRVSRIAFYRDIDEALVALDLPPEVATQLSANNDVH